MIMQSVANAHRYWRSHQLPEVAVAAEPLYLLSTVHRAAYRKASGRRLVVNSQQP